MSFGRPGTLDNFKVTPPARGSFPLDHDGECRDFMLSYLKCLKANKSDNGQCRVESRNYLQCRMDNGLMQKDDMANLGLGDVGTSHAGPSPIVPPTQTTSTKPSEQGRMV